MGTYDMGGGAAAGAQSAAQGIGSAFKALAMAPIVSQQAEQNQALILAKIFANQQSGGKHEAESNLLRKKLEDINSVQLSPDRATPVAQSYFSVSGSSPFDNVGNTGRSINRATGKQIDAGTLAKIWDSEAMSRVGENNAQAGAASALAQQRLNNPNGAQDGFENAAQRLDLSAYNTAYPVNSMTGTRPIPKGADPELHLKTYLEAAKLMRQNGKGSNKNPTQSDSSQTINPSNKPFTPSSEMIAVQGDYHAGKITRDQAKKKLKELGMPD